MCKPELTGEDYVTLITYYLLQDRFDESLKLINCESLKNWKFESGVMKVQFDYLKAYLSLYTDGPKFETAENICRDYLAYPVLFWRNMFVGIANQLAEIDQTEKLEVSVLEGENLAKTNLASADQEEFIDITVVDKTTLLLTFRNIAKFQLKFFKTDLEVMFSTGPFLSGASKEFSYVSPYHEDAIECAHSQAYSDMRYEIPESLKKENLYIQVTAGGQSKTVRFLPTNLLVNIQENYGILKV
jgi:hypothetical protein